MPTRKRHSPEQVVRKLATADRMLGEGRDVADVCRNCRSPSRRTTAGDLIAGRSKNWSEKGFGAGWWCWRAVDGAGRLYAVQAPRQLLRPGGGLVHLNDVVVRDWPHMPIRDFGVKLISQVNPRLTTK